MRMRCLALAAAVLAVLHTTKGAGTTKAGCKQVKKENGDENYKYSNSWDGNTFQDGTTVNLSCSSGPVIGQPLMRCDNGKWTPKLGRCGSNCSQEFLRKLGYSEMRVNGSHKDGDAPHNSDVEFICGEEAHKYHCYDGTFLSQSAFEPCGSCSTADMAGLGYAGMNVHGNTLNGHLVEGSAVSLLCRDELHWFSCINGELLPHLESESSCGCAPPSSNTTNNARVIFSTSPESGTYASGTEVVLFCKSGPVVGGASESVCIGGDWYPPLGHCAKMCDKDDLTKMKFENAELSDPADTQLQYHGGRASATCTVNSTSTSYNMTCIDGDWWAHWTI